MEKSKKIYEILLDCDVISHFISNHALNDLPDILYPHQCIVLDYVYNEVAIHPARLAFLKPLLKSGKITRKNLPDNAEIAKEFALIKSMNPLIGNGERACMAVARFNNNVVASSNFRDVAPYCNRHKILYLGTLDILSVAATKEMYDEAKCDEFIYNAKKYNNASFPKDVTQMKHYIPKDLEFI